jgi:hypothetical protein
MAASRAKGLKNLSAALDELRDFTSADGRSTLRAAVRVPMGRVMKRAKTKLAAISPGQTPLHRTYRGRLVSAGFASRNLRVIVKMNRAGTSATAILGVRAEAFYAVAFFEKGTSKIPKQPFLVPSLEESQGSAPAEVGAAFQKRILQIASRYARARVEGEA